jgi:teichoic acid transport system ATP-binding protein
LILEKGVLTKVGPAKEVVDLYNRLTVNCSGEEGKVVAHMSQTEMAHQVNPDENRYGNGKAEIIEIGIESSDKNASHTFIHGQPCRFWFKTLFHETVENPITAFTIKEVKGFDLSGTNTMFKDIKVGTVHKGEVLLTEFRQRMMLNAGGYLLSFGCAGFEDEEYVVYDRRYDVITLEVVSKKSSVGMFDLDSKIKVSRI